MRDLNELNINEYGVAVKMPKPTSGQIASIERLVDGKLPHSYIEFLMFSNGGHPEVDTFYVEINGSRQGWAVNRFFHISSDPNITEDVVWNYQHRWANAPKKILPIADDGGGNLICLDLTKSNTAPIVLWIHDSSFSQSLFKVADTFETFIDSLTTNPDYI